MKIRFFDPIHFMRASGLGLTFAENQNESGIHQREPLQKSAIGGMTIISGKDGMIHVHVTQPCDKTQEQCFKTPSTVIIGRASPCGCRLEKDALVSRCHAVLSMRQTGVTIRDLDSLNGIVVNGIHYGGPSSRKMAQPVQLMDGDTVVIGETILTFSLMVRKKPASATNSAQIIQPGRASRFRRTRTIPGFLIESIIGSGGMGVVYQARELASGRTVAIKTMHPDIADNKRGLEHFLREIEVTRKINHPNIVAFRSSGVTPGALLYLVLEHADGGDLAQYLGRYSSQRMPTAQVHDFALQIAEGLAHVHSLGIVHRDIKPRNILLTRGQMPVVKISDLGLACHEEETTMAESGAGGGTVAYMPPEQLTRLERIGPAGDVFSAGATLYEMLSGRRPYDLSRCDRLRAVSKGLITPLSHSGVPVHPGLAAVVDKCIAPRPEARFQDCGQLLSALKNLHI